MTGVSCAVFWNVAVVHRVSAHNPHELHLQGCTTEISFHPTLRNRNVKCYTPGNRCSRARCCTWSLESARTCYSRPLLLWHTPKKDAQSSTESFPKYGCQQWNSPLGCHSHTPLLAPLNHFHTRKDPKTERKKEGDLSLTHLYKRIRAPDIWDVP